MSKWDMGKLGDVCNLSMGQSPDSSSYNQEGDGIPFYQGNADFGDLHPITRFHCSQPTKIARKNDILISVRAPIGAINIATEPCCIGRGLAALTAKADQLDTKYLYYVLSYMNRELNSKGTGSTFKAISKQTLSEVKLPLPPLEAQRKISKTLDTVSDILAMRKQQLAELDNFIKSTFYDMFGDPVTNEKGWVKKPLVETCSIITGNTPSRRVAENYGEYIEWIKSDNITESLYITPAKEYLSDIGFAKCRYIDKPSILMTCIAGSLNSIGSVAITDRKVAFNQQINAIIPGEYDLYFLYSMLQLSKGYIHSTINMSLKGILSKGKLSELEFIIPSIELQRQFRLQFNKIAGMKDSLNKASEQAQLLFNSLMSRYFD